MRQIHVIVFEPLDAQDGLPKYESKIEYLPAATLPSTLISAYFSLLRTASILLPDVGMRGGFALLDLNTVSFSGKQIIESKQIRRKDALADLTYSLLVEGWSDDFRTVKLSALHKRRPSRIIGLVSKKCDANLDRCKRQAGCTCQRQPTDGRDEFQARLEAVIAGGPGSMFAG